MMRFLLLTMSLFFFSSLYSQEVSMTKNEKNYNALIFIDINGQVDTLLKFPGRVSVSEAKIFDDRVCVVIETTIAFFYFKFNKKEDDWGMARTTGCLAGNHKYSSMIDERIWFHAHSFQILEEDLVTYKVRFGGDKPEETITYDCKEFEKAYLKRKKEYQEYLKKKKNEK